MDPVNEILYDLLLNDTYVTLPTFLDRFDILLTSGIGVKRVDATDDTDADFVREISTFPRSEAILEFGKSLKDLKCVILDSRNRPHEVCVQHVGKKHLRISETSVPWDFENRIYRSLVECIQAFKRHVRNLQDYFDVLDRIQEFCTVMEPVSPTYKDGKRGIVLVENILLSLEVCPDGSVKDLRLVGQYGQQNRQLEEKLKAWDHDVDVATNVLEIVNSISGGVALPGTPALVAKQVPVEVPSCAICLYVVLPGDNKVPRKLCQNSKCGVYFHENCLYECLTSIRPATLGAAIGTCPACSRPISYCSTDF